MSEEATFAAVYTNFKTVPSRKVVTVTLEVPMENGNAAIKALGMPNPEKTKWVAVAVLVDTD